MRVPPRAAAILALTLLAVGCGVACTRSSSEVGPAKASAPAVGTGTSAGAPGASSAAGEAPSTPLSPECEALLSQIKVLEARIPTRFYALDRPVELIYQDIVACSDLCQRVLKECPGPTADCYVRGLLARLLFVGISNYQQELNKAGRSEEEVARQIEARFEEVRQLAERSLACCAPKSKERLKTLRVLIDFYSQRGPFVEVPRLAALLLEEYPDLGATDKADLYQTVAISYRRDGNYDAMVKYLDEIIAKHEKDREYVLYMHLLFDALTGTGDLERMEEVVHILMAECPSRLPELMGTGQPRTYCEQWMDVGTFWLGFINYALGDVDEGRDYFLKSQEHLEGKIGKLKAEKKGVDPVIDIYLKFRTKDYLRFLYDVHGKVPSVDFDLEGLWATPNTLTLRESRGKVVVVVFRVPYDEGAAAFLQEIDSMVKEKEKEGLAAVTLCFLTGKPDPAGDLKALDEMRADLDKLGVSLPGGYDPDRVQQSIFRALHGNVGPSPSCVILNRKGEVAWYLNNPRNMDRKIARRVIERLLKEEK